MGLYYNPNPPHIGAQQPLDQKKLTPPQSGPPPQNPPFSGGAQIAQAIMACWTALTVTNAIAPVTARNLTPPTSVTAKTPYNPARYEIYRAWDAPAPAPIVANNLDPPISGPPPQNPPIGRVRVPDAVQVSWLPQPPTYYPNFVADDFAPYLQVAAPSYIPIGSKVPVAVQVSWLLPLPAPIVATNMDPPIAGPTPQNPPFAGTRVSVEVQVAWLPLPPAPIVVDNLSPPIAGPTPQNPPLKGSPVPVPVQVAWLPVPQAPVLPTYAVQVNTSNASWTPPSLDAVWLPPPPPIVSARNLSPPISGPTPQNPPFPGARVPVEVQIAWLPPAAMPILQDFIAPPISAPTIVYVPVGTRVPVEVQVAWLPRAPDPIVVDNLSPPISGPVPQNPPFPGTRVPVEVQVAWLPPVLLPIVGFVGQPSSGPIVVQYVPVGSKVPVEVQVSWISQPVVLPRSPLYLESAPPSSLFTGAVVPVATRSWWNDGWTLPQRSSVLFQGVATFTFGPRLPQEILQSWNPAPWRTQSQTIRIPPNGPVPSQPPLGGGALIRKEVLVNWIPPPPAPILAINGGTIASSGYTFIPSWRVAYVLPIDKVATVPAINKVAIAPKGT